MSMDASCRGLDSSDAGPFQMELTRGKCNIKTIIWNRPNKYFFNYANKILTFCSQFFTIYLRKFLEIF